MKLKIGKKSGWELIFLVGIILINILTIMTIYSANSLVLANTSDHLKTSVNDSSNLSNNISNISGSKDESTNFPPDNSNSSNLLKSSINDNIIMSSALQSSTSLANTQTQAVTGTSQGSNIFANNTVDTTKTFQLNLTNSYSNSNNIATPFTLPSLVPNYTNTSGSFNISNVQEGFQSTSINGTMPSNPIISNSLQNTINVASSGNTIRIATSFIVTQNKINITQLRLSYSAVASPGSANVYITGITSSKPNSTLYGANMSVTISTNPSQSYLNISYSTPVTLSKGTYAIVFNAGFITKTVTIYSQSDTITGNKSLMWTYKQSTGWTSVANDLIFGYMYLVVTSSGQKQTYTSPNQINLLYNGQSLSSSTFTNNNIQIASANVLFTSNISVWFTISYIIYYKSITNPIIPSVTFNAVNGTDPIWNATITSYKVPNGTYSIINHILQLYNLPNSWNSLAIYRNSSLYANVTTITMNSTIIYSNGSSILLLNISSIISAYNWTFSFISPNYIKSLNLVQNSIKTLTLPYQLNSSDVLNTYAETSDPVSGQNGSLFVYNSVNNLVYHEINIGIVSNQLIFSTWNISHSLNLNTDSNGFYTLEVQWINTNQTELGFMSITFELFMQTRPLLVSTNATLYVQGETINVTVNYLSAYNGTNLNSANLTYLNSWDSSHGILTQSSSHSSYTVYISSDAAVQGLNQITIFASLGGYVNRSISITFQVVYKLQTIVSKPNVVSGLNKLGYTESIDLFWRFSNNNSLVTNPSYSIMLNNTLLNNFNSYGILPINNTNGASYTLQLKIDFDPILYNFMRGFYNYTISFSNRFLISQVISLPIFVNGYNVNLTLSYSHKFYNENNYPITAIVTYTNNSQSSTTISTQNIVEPLLSLNKNLNIAFKSLQSPLLGSPVAGIDVLFNIGVTLKNGTRTIFTSTHMTDSNGKAIYVLPLLDTVDIKSFSYINASISQSTYNDAYTYNDLSVKTGIVVQTPSDLTIYVEFLLAGLIILLLAILSYGIYIFVQRKQVSSTKVTKSYYDQLMLISNIYALLVTTASGLPIFNIIKTEQIENTEITSLISGLSVGMDSFLQNFQQDFLKHLVQDSNSEANEETTSGISISTIDRETFKILIASSPSFRVFVFLKEKTFTGTDNLFRTMITNLETNLAVEDIIDDTIIAPQVEKIINIYFPIVFLKTFTINMPKFTALFSDNNANRESILSLEALNALKNIFLVYFGQLKPEDLSSEKANKFFDELMHTGHLPAIGNFKYEELLIFLEKQLKLSPKIIYELLWTAGLYEVRLFIVGTH